MPSPIELAAKVALFADAADTAHAIVNGPATGAGSTVEVESGALSTFAKVIADFEYSVITVSALLVLLGVPSYANLTAANAALPIGLPYFDTALNKLQITTA